MLVARVFTILSLDGGSKKLVLSLVSVVCSLISKEQGVTVVAVCLVYDLFVANQVAKCTFYIFISIIINALMSLNQHGLKICLSWILYNTSDNTI